MIRRLIVPLTLAVASLHAGQACAQGAFPAPLPGQAAAAPVTSFGAGPALFPSDGLGRAEAAEDCTKGFMPLREEAEKRGKLIKVASARHASAGEVCKLIGSFGVAEVKMLKYVEAHVAQCGTPQQVLDQLRTGHKNTEGMQQRICSVAFQQHVQQRGPSGPTGDVWTLPEKQLSGDFWTLPEKHL